MSNGIDEDGVYLPVVRVEDKVVLANGAANIWIARYVCYLRCVWKLCQEIEQSIQAVESLRVQRLDIALSGRKQNELAVQVVPSVILSAYFDRKPARVR